MAFGNVLRGFGQRAMDIGRSTMGRARDVGRSTMDRAMDSRIGQSIIDSPLGRAAGNLGSAAGNYSQMMISRLASRLGISEEAVKKLLIGGSGVGTAAYMMGDDDPSLDELAISNAMEMAEQGHPFDNTIRDRFGFGIDARRLTDE